MITLDKIKSFIADEVALGYERCSVRPSSALNDVVYLHVEDSSISFLFLERLSVAVSPDFHIFSCVSDYSGRSFDIQFILG